MTNVYNDIRNIISKEITKGIVRALKECEELGLMHIVKKDTYNAPNADSLKPNERKKLGQLRNRT